MYVPANAVNTISAYTDLGTTGTAIPTANTDDANSAATGIGFTFVFNTVPFTDFVLNTNGFIRLGTAAPTGPQYTDGGQSTTNGPVTGPDPYLILPFNQDLTAGSAGGTAYRVATTGTAPHRVCTIQWKNVSDKPRTTFGTQYANISFQVKLHETSNQIDFVYDMATPGVGYADIGKYMLVGLKGLTAHSSVLATKESGQPWSGTTFVSLSQIGNAHSVRGAMPPDPGLTYSFLVTENSDVAVKEIQGFGSVALPMGSPVTLRAVIRNAGILSQSNVPVTLSISGANSYTRSQQVGVVSAGRTTVTFANINLTNEGLNTVTVSVPSDDNNDNNSLTQNMVTSATTFSYIVAGMPVAGANGAGASAVASTRALCARFTTNAACNVTAVRAFIYADPALVSQPVTVYGVVLHPTTGAVIARSDDYIIRMADLGQLHTFNLWAHVPAGDFLVGLAQVRAAGAPAFYPLGSQIETPSRADLYYLANIGSPSVPPATLVSSGANGAGTTRLMLEAETALMLGTSTALQRAVSVFPNPSASGLFNVEIHGANTRQALGVEVLNLLGQRVYTGGAKDDGRTAVDLSGLAAGIYTLTLRSGRESVQQKISIVH